MNKASLIAGGVGGALLLVIFIILLSGGSRFGRTSEHPLGQISDFEQFFEEVSLVKKEPSGRVKKKLAEDIPSGGKVLRYYNKDKEESLYVMVSKEGKIVAFGATFFNRPPTAATMQLDPIPHFFREYWKDVTGKRPKFVHKKHPSRRVYTKATIDTEKIKGEWTKLEKSNRMYFQRVKITLKP